MIIGSTDTIEGTPCYNKLKPYDLSNNLNSVVENMNVNLFIQSLREASLSLLRHNIPGATVDATGGSGGSGGFPPSSWSKECSPNFDATGSNGNSST